MWVSTPADNFEVDTEDDWLNILSHQYLEKSPTSGLNTEHPHFEGIKNLVENVDYQRLGDTIFNKAEGLGTLISRLGGTEKLQENKDKKNIKEIQKTLEDLDEMGSPTAQKLASDPWNIPKELRKIFELMKKFKDQMGGGDSLEVLVEDDKGTRLKAVDEDLVDTINKHPVMLRSPFEMLDRLEDKDYKKSRVETQNTFRLVLIDDSGSMSSSCKVRAVRALLYLLRDLVIKGDTIYILLYERDIHDATLIESLEEMDDYIEKFEEGSLGGTYIGEVLEEISKNIVAGKRDLVEIPQKTEIIIIMDGEDDVDSTLKLPVPVHSIVLGTQNKDLEIVCTKSGGSYNIYTLDELRL